MEFIIQRQEVFSENMDKLGENMEKADKRISRLERGFVALFDLQNQISTNQKEMIETNRQLQDAQKHTDEKLNVLIDVVERFISAGSNGRKGNGRKRQKSKRNRSV